MVERGVGVEGRACCISYEDNNHGDFLTAVWTENMTGDKRRNLSESELQSLAGTDGLAGRHVPLEAGKWIYGAVRRYLVVFRDAKIKLHS